jgi:LmbE family N-acetylglucosaminyl deacetylase
MNDHPLRIILIGAHPDDCELKAGGTAILWSERGHQVKFVAMTGGDNGHPTMAGGALQQRRRQEAREAQQRLGIQAYDVLDHHGGELLVTLETRREVVRLIRDWRADVVVTHRSNDYHPDHRYTSLLVQDAAYMVTVPFFATSTPALERNPAFFYFRDDFQRPNPFRSDAVVPIDQVFERKLDALDAHISQMYEWMPFMMQRSSGRPEPVPKDPAARREWLTGVWFSNEITPDIRRLLVDWYGPAGDAVRHAEAFELCEYGRQPNPQEMRKLFPMAKP